MGHLYGGMEESTQPVPSVPCITEGKQMKEGSKVMTDSMGAISTSATERDNKMRMRPRTYSPFRKRVQLWLAQRQSESDEDSPTDACASPPDEERENAKDTPAAKESVLDICRKRKLSW